MLFGKRGEYSSTEVWFLIAAIALAAFSGIGILDDIRDRLDQNLLERNFIARDLSMVIEALYASPGEVKYTYNLGKYDYFIDIRGGKVSVKDSFDEQDPVSYRFVGVSVSDPKYVVPLANPEGLKVKAPEYRTIRNELPDCSGKRALVLGKHINGDGSAEITVDGKNVLICEVGDEACEGRVVECE